MDLNAKQAADTLRKMANIKQMLVFPYDTGKIINTCADLIESLASELEQVKQERDGLNILLTQAQSMLETRTRERDAAVEDMKDKTFGCEKCKHYFVGNRFCDMPIDKRKPSFGCWQWRGIS